MKSFVCAVLFFGTVQAQNVVEPWFSFSTGVGISSAANSSVAASVGETFSGASRNGNVAVYSGFFSAVAGQSFVTSVNHEVALPLSFELYQNYPNPFNPSTTIRYDIAQRSRVTIAVYNLLGQQVVVLVHDEKSPGRYTEVWRGNNDEGSQVASGVYFYRIQAQSIDGAERDFVMTKKLVLVK